jgi:ankyrin repeat protein
MSRRYINDFDELNNTVLIWACYYERSDMVREIIEMGGLVNFKNNKGRTALSYAVETMQSVSDQLKIVETLLQSGAKTNFFDYNEISPLLTAISFDNSPVVRLLIEAGADVELRPRDGYTLLFVAVDRNNIEITRLLIEAGADINKISDDMTPLHAAIERDNIDMINLLIESGADVNLKSEGSAPIMTAIMYKNTNIIDRLISARTNLETTDNKGYTPLILASRLGNLAYVKKFINLGVDINKKDNLGHSAIENALQSGHNNIAEFILNVVIRRRRPCTTNSPHCVNIQPLPQPQVAGVIKRKMRRTRKSRR